MRSDLTKLLCEHERSRSSDGYHLVRRKKAFNPVPEDSPSREGMTHRYSSNAKSFGEFLSPLKGQVRKAVGRRWDSFSTNFDDGHRAASRCTCTSTAKSVHRRDGVMCVSAVTDRPSARGSSVEIYVDPRDKSSARNKRYRYRTAAPRRTRAAVRTEVEIDMIRYRTDRWSAFHFARDAPAGEWVECSTGKSARPSAMYIGQLVANEPARRRSAITRRSALPLAGCRGASDLSDHIRTPIERRGPLSRFCRFELTVRAIPSASSPIGRGPALKHRSSAGSIPVWRTTCPPGGRRTQRFKHRRPQGRERSNSVGTTSVRWRNRQTHQLEGWPSGRPDRPGTPFNASMRKPKRAPEEGETKVRALLEAPFLRGRRAVLRQAHNLKVARATRAPASSFGRGDR